MMAIIFLKHSKQAFFDFARCYPLIIVSVAAPLASSCIHPKVGIRKAFLLDPMMDPAQPGSFSETLTGSVQGTYEKAIASGGGASGGSCPTCK